MLPIFAVLLGAAFYALWARREGLLALESYRRGQLSELSATLGNLQEAVFVVDAQNRVLLANHALRRIFADADTLLGTQLDAARHGQELLDYLEVVRLRMPTPRRRIKFEAKPLFSNEPLAGSSAFDGSPLREASGAVADAGGEGLRAADAVWAEVAGALMPPLSGRGGEGAWVLVILHDITHQQKLETVRKDFVANVSHELRTPLSVIMGYVETLVDGGATIPEETRAEFLLKIQRHTQRLNALLDDLLSLSRLESDAPGLVRERVDLGALVCAVVEDYRGRPAVVSGQYRLRLASGGGIAAADTASPVDLDARAGRAAEERAAAAVMAAGFSVWGDPRQLTQALENLIDNALKYTPSGSTIWLSVRRSWLGGTGGTDSAETRAGAEAQPRFFGGALAGMPLVDDGRERTGGWSAAGEVEVCVRDDGPGIPAEDLPHLFERFYRVDKGRSRAQGGTGLGLSIVKHIVQLHGGRVWARSRDAFTGGRGAAFYFTLPLAGEGA